MPPKKSSKESKNKDENGNKKKSNKKKGHEFTPSEVSLILTYLLVYSKAKSLAFFKKTYKDLKVEVKKEKMNLESEQKQNYEYVRALQEINDQLLSEITDNNISKKLPLYMKKEEAFTSVSKLYLNNESTDAKNENIKHKKKNKPKESATEKTIKNTYKFKYEEQIRTLDEEIQKIIEKIIERRKYSQKLDEENKNLDNELATIKSNLKNPLDGKVKELNEIYTTLIEKNKEEIKNIYEKNNKKAAISKRFAEEKMCNIEDSANMMQFESLSRKSDVMNLEISGNGNKENISFSDEEKLIIALLKKREMKKKEYLNNSYSLPEDKVDDAIYSKYNLKRYRYTLPCDIHRKLNLKNDDQNMCTRLVQLTNYNLNSLEPYNVKKDKMDTYLIVKKYLDMINEQRKKENFEKKSRWMIKKPDSPKQIFLSEKNEVINCKSSKKQFDSYYDFMDVNDITKIEDINRLTELKIASYDYYKRSINEYNVKSTVNHNIPNIRLYNKHYGKLVDFKKMEKEIKFNFKKESNNNNIININNKIMFGDEYIRNKIENNKEIDKMRLEDKKKHRDRLYDNPLALHPVMSITDKAIAQYNKRKELNEIDIKRLLNYQIIKNKNIKQNIHNIDHINNVNEIIEKKGNKKDLFLDSYNNIFKEKNIILDDKDTNLFDNNGKFKDILSLEMDPYKKYCNLDPIIEYEINKALDDNSMKNGDFFWFKSEKKPIENIDIINNASISFISELMKNSKISKPPYYDINNKYD